MKQTKRAAPIGSPNNSVKRSEDNYFKKQLKTIFEYWQNHIATASMVSKATGIPHKNICRYKRDLERAGQLFEIRKTYCIHTGFKAWYITTNKDLADTLKRLDKQYRQKGGAS